MAVPGADWRKSTDGYRTGTPYRACSDRSGTDGSPAAADPRTNGDGQTIAGTLADNTGKSEHVEVANTAKTGDIAAPEPLAIGVSAGTAVATEWPGDGYANNVDAGASGTVRGPQGYDFDGSGIYLRYFTPRSETRRHAVIVT
jgi:hypothetical protein